MKILLSTKIDPVLVVLVELSLEAYLEVVLVVLLEVDLVAVIRILEEHSLLVASSKLP